MTTWGNTISQANEAIQIVVRSPSIMRGIDRTVLKSPTNDRKLGLFTFGIYPYESIYPLPPLPVFPTAPQIAVADAYFLQQYKAQINAHLLIDNLLMTVEFEPMVTDNITDPSRWVRSRIISNATLVNMFQTNTNLPPNKNVIFVMRYQNHTPISAGDTTIKSLATINTGAVQSAAGWQIYPYYDVKPNAFQTILSSGSRPVWDLSFIRRTNSLGKIPDMDAVFTCYSNAPFTGDKYNLRFATNLAVADIDPIFDTLKLEVYEIKDRYDVDATFPFYVRRYQELTDNEWDTDHA